MAQAAAVGGGTVTATQTLDSWSGTLDLPVVSPVGALVEAKDNRNLTVPAGGSALRVTTDWGNPALALYGYDPSGKLIGSSAQGASVSESVAIPNPVAGSYEVVLEGCLTTLTDLPGYGGDRHCNGPLIPIG